jgi:hypothetical protein
MATLLCLANSSEDKGNKRMEAAANVHRINNRLHNTRIVSYLDPNIRKMAYYIILLSIQILKKCISRKVTVDKFGKIIC